MSGMQRRAFLGATGVAMAQSSSAPTPAKFGVDLFSIRSSGWNAFQYLDYCARFQVGVVHFSEIRFLGSLDDDHIRKVKAHADRLGIELEIGMRSICPSSKLFDPSQGTAEQQLSRVIRAGQLAGSRLVRAFLGSMADRTAELPIEAHIENTVKVLRAVRSRAQDANLKIAIENHAGDMQGRELKMLIEEAGADFVGACIDSGNPVWSLEDPHVTLDTLHPYVLTSHVRDSLLWRTPEGIAVRWTRMGEGNVNIDAYLRKYLQLCPGKAISMEIIVTPPRTFPVFDPKFWDGYRNVPAWSFARFLSLAEQGAPTAPPPKPADPAAQERADLEASIAYTKRLLNL
jgi:sugar phosphate isomerase/epimerase